MNQPKLQLLTRVSPKAIPVSGQDRMVAVVVDVIAPNEAAGSVSRPLNLALLIDKSGSMQGPKIETACKAAERVVQALADIDRFTLIAFNDAHEIVIPATQVGGSRDAIINRIRGIEADSKTNLAGALQAAFDNLRPHCGVDVTSTIYLLTDGEVHDAEACLPLAATALQQGISLYAGGIGDNYKHEFLDAICADPVQKGKNLVEDISLAKLTQMSTRFEDFLKRKGHVVTANCRLTVDVARGAELVSACAKEHGRPLVFDQSRSTALSDLAAGVNAEHLFEFLVTSKLQGSQPLAQFRLRYDLPGSGVTGADVAGSAAVEITDDQRRMVRDPDVTKVERSVTTSRMMEAAEKDLADPTKDKRHTTRLLGRVTKHLEAVGETEKAKEVADLQQQVEQSDEASRDVLVKRARGTTGLLNR